jgi:hypothetical protein
MFNEYYIYLDESGDLGWNFSGPYTKGGSSRYFTICGLVVCAQDKHRPERVMKKLREYCEKKHDILIPVGDEIKSTDLSGDSKGKFCEILLAEASKSKFFKVFSITVNKEKVATASIFRNDTNTLYNYMTKVGIIEKVAEIDKLVLFADQRITSTDAKYAFDTYLKTELAGTFNSNATLEIHHKSSHSCRKIQCADIITNLIWRSHEFGSAEYLDKISHLVIDKKLFF